MNVVKIGGSSLRSPDDFEHLAAHLLRDHPPPTVVVLSALPLVTRHLEEAAYLAECGQLDESLRQIRSITAQHITLAHTILRDTPTIDALMMLFDDIATAIARLLEGVAITKELTPRTLDRIASAGERMALHLVHHVLRERGLDVTALPATELVVTDDTFGNARPDIEQTANRVRTRLLPLLQQGGVVLTEGFVGTTIDGRITTMGKESSNLTAALLAVLLGAHTLVLYTPVAGIYTADPHRILTARRIEQLSYDHAEYLAYAGLKLLYPTMIEPLRRDGISLQITALGQQYLGTYIGDRATPDGTFVVFEESLVAVELHRTDYYHALCHGWHHRGIAVDRGSRLLIAADPHEIAHLSSIGVATISTPRECVQLRVWATSRSPHTLHQFGHVIATVLSSATWTIAYSDGDLLATAIIWSPAERVLPALHEQLLSVSDWT